jgi:hypothetical protein
MVWWRRGPGYRNAEDVYPEPATAGRRGVIFDRLSLDLTAVREVGREMVRLSGDGAELVMRSLAVHEVPPERLDDPSRVDLEFLTLETGRRLPEGVLQLSGVGLQDPFPFIRVGTQEVGLYGSLSVTCGDPVRLAQATDEMARLIVKLGRPRPTFASWPWLVAGLAIAALILLPAAAAFTGELSPLLWPPTAVIAVLGTVALWRWARPLATRSRNRQSVLVVDPTPRREVRLMRANHRRDARVALLGFIVGAVVALIPNLSDIFGSSP